jgi:tetrahydromethanopterin S-methyltransferase subunit G
MRPRGDETDFDVWGIRGRGAHYRGTGIGTGFTGLGAQLPRRFGSNILARRIGFPYPIRGCVVPRSGSGLPGSGSEFRGRSVQLRGIDTRIDGIDTGVDGIDTGVDGIDTEVIGRDTRVIGRDIGVVGRDTGVVGRDIDRERRGGLFIYLMSFSDKVDGNLLIKICDFINNNINYILFISILLSCYIIYSKINNFVSIRFKNYNEEDKEKLIKLFKISIVTISIFLFIFF